MKRLEFDLLFRWFVDIGVDEELQARVPHGDDQPPPSSGGRNAEVDFKGQKRPNETHQSTTDPEVRLYRNGPGMEARLGFIGHTLMEKRSCLIVDTRLPAPTATPSASPPCR